MEQEEHGATDVQNLLQHIHNQFENNVGTLNDEDVYIPQFDVRFTVIFLSQFVHVKFTSLGISHL